MTKPPNNKLKVLVLTSAHTADDVRIYHKVSCSLANAGFEVHLIAPEFDPNFDAGKVYLHYFKKTTSRLGRFIFAPIRAFNTARKIKADIVQIHDPDLLVIGLLLKILGYKVIYDAHEDFRLAVADRNWIPILIKPMIRGIIGLIEWVCTSFFDHITVATASIANRFPADKTTIINNYPKKGELALDLTSGKETVKANEIAYIGGISEERGLIETLDSLILSESECTLALAGKFSSDVLFAEFKKHEGYSKTNYLGQISRDEVAKVLSRVSIGIVTFLPLPNHIEARPNKLFEYMSAGIPVIASHFPQWKEIVEGAECGICVDPENPAEIAKAIDWLIHNPKKARNMGEKGRKMVEEHWNWEVEEKHLIKTINGLMDNK